ncbi:hypothetical protein [Aureimonas leprariae]|uniref:Lipoprotein n=1 Tax=Plantimonas leprariae TaxID=2615207 RepID=A0A7V7TWH6_9HYPH|nr:hypothetical protein [Aureimonas leprariae]KAB0679978.1 hypothetical protein F6X38_10420 [Aureimonas leprariae]
MKFLLGLAPLAFLGGCMSTNPGSPLEAYSVPEARCAAIREHVPFDERNTSRDPTVGRGSFCDPATRYVRAEPPETDSPFYIVGAAVDAATY